jgi:hypothetical protein
MSLEYLGGASFRIEDTAKQIREWIRERKAEPKPKKAEPEKPKYVTWGGDDLEYDWTPHPYYLQHHPDVGYIQTAEALKAKTLEYLDLTAGYLLLAAKMAYQADLLLSDDNGPETFCMECEQILAQHEAGGWPEESDGEEEP